MKKVGKMSGEGKRWKWKTLNVTSWKGSPAKRMPGFHLRKNKKLSAKGKGKGKRKGLNSPTTAVTAGTVPQPPVPQFPAAPQPAVPQPAVPQFPAALVAQPIAPVPSQPPVPQFP